MTEALDEIDINGVKTTIPFHRKVISSKLFKNAELSTSFIDRLKSQGNL
jgi:acetyl-CoA carboxylase biotin carboxylase subunit